MTRTDDPHPHIHRLRAMGMSDQVIYNRLLLEGYPEDMLGPIFLARGLPEAKVLTTEAPMVRKTSSRRVSALASGLVIFAFAASGSSLYMFLKPPVSYSISLATASSTVSALSYGALPALSDTNFYSQTREELIAQKVSFIDADLSAMRLTVYKEGEKALEVPIASKGRVGSWWETPAGLYKIETKTVNGWSTFGEVYMPYSMRFQGNFFIHGWPYYEGGEPVASTYSGGCIRLSTEDAKKVFELTSVGMPVMVYSKEAEKVPFPYELKAPAISASAYLVADVQSGIVLTSKGASVAAPIASISKLLTALVAADYINLDKELYVPESAHVYTSIPRLKEGESVRAYDLLFLLLRESSNEAAETLAASIGRETFVRRMNEKARSIDLTHTVFSDPSGAKGDYSTPEDLFTVLKYIYENRRFVFGITSGAIENSAYGPPAFKNIQNFNLIRGSDAKLLGGKIGQTREASETYAGVFSVRLGEEERAIAIIVLGSKDSPGDVKKLLDLVQRTYATAAD